MIALLDKINGAKPSKIRGKGRPFGRKKGNKPFGGTSRQDARTKCTT
jgi:hypothetical protein